MIDTESIRESLVELGYNLKDLGDHWRSNAKYRDGENPTALKIYKNSGGWYDFVANNKGSYIELLKKTVGEHNKQLIKKYIPSNSSDKFNVKISEIQGQKITMEEIYSEEILKKLLPHYSFYNNRGIDDSVLKEFKSGLATRGQMYQRYVFPVYNNSGKIHGFAGRDMRDDNTGNRPKWKHIGKKTNWVYPYYTIPECRDSIIDSGEVIIVESIGDALNLFQNGIKNILVAFGLDVSSQLACALVGMPVKNIVISFNNDKDKSNNRGLEGSINSYYRLLNFFDKERLRICLPNKNDFGDMDQSDFDKWAKKKDSMDPLKQVSHIISESEKMINNGSLKKIFYRKINELK